MLRFIKKHFAALVLLVWGILYLSVMVECWNFISNHYWLFFS